MSLSKIICLLLLFNTNMPAQIPTKKPVESFFIANANASDKVFDNSILDFYTTEELNLGDFTIPIHTRFSAIVNFVGGRAYLRVRSIKVGNEIHPVDWNVVGPDYKEGIPIIETDNSIEVYEDQRLTFKATFARVD